MKRRPSIRYTQEQKTLMWDCYQKGDSIREMAALFDRYHPSISGIFAKTGGVRAVLDEQEPTVSTSLAPPREGLT